MIVNMLPIYMSCNRNLKVRKHFLCKLHTDLMCLLRSDVIVLLEALVIMVSYDTFILIEYFTHYFKIFVCIFITAIDKGCPFSRSGIDLSNMVKAFTEIFFHIVQLHCFFFSGNVADSILHVTAVSY